MELNDYVLRCSCKQGHVSSCTPDSGTRSTLHTRQWNTFHPAHQKVEHVPPCTPDSRTRFTLHTRQWNTFHPVHQTVEHVPPCTPDSYPYRKTSTKCRINTVVSPDDGHIPARNIVEIDKYKYKRRKNQQMTQVRMFIHSRLTQHVSGFIMPIVRRTDCIKPACGVSLYVLAAVVWSRDTS